jgi:hypothetical protein
MGRIRHGRRKNPGRDKSAGVKDEWWAMLDLNQRPPVCETGALTN